MQTPSPLKPKARRASARAAATVFFNLCALFACFAGAPAQQPAAAARPAQIIPAPKSLTATGESFRLTRDVRIMLADPKSEDDRFAAQDFVEDLRETATVS